MTAKEVAEKYKLNDGVVIFEPSDVYSKAIIGVSEDHNHLIYDYVKMIESLFESIKEDEHYLEEDGVDEDLVWQDATDWIEYNTIRSIPYLGDKAPIIHYDEEEEIDSD